MSRARELDGALAAQQATVQELRAAQEKQANALASEQAALAQLSETRDRIVSLIARLKQRVHAEDVAAVARAFQGADHVSYGQWADMLLHIFDAPTCRENRVVVVAWQVQEFTQAAWNPLATTHRMPGSTDFNGVGVQNFISLEQGLEATKETIQNGWDVYGYGADRRVAPSMRRRVDDGVEDRGIQLVPRVPGRELRRGGRAEGRSRPRDLCLAMSRVVTRRDETATYLRTSRLRARSRTFNRRWSVAQDRQQR